MVCRIPQGQSFLYNEKHMDRPSTAVFLENVSAIRKKITDNNHCTYEMIDAALGIRSVTLLKILHEGVQKNSFSFGSL
jgi:hypothetical protein